MVRDKRVSAQGTAVILLAAVFFPVSGYAGTLAMGTLNFYGYSHNIIVFLSATVVITPPPYFLTHLQLFVQSRVHIPVSPRPLQITRIHNQRNQRTIRTLLTVFFAAVYNTSSSMTDD
jgi:hypothetical protein